MTSKPKITSKLIAPCGMNCALCMAYLLRKKDKCPGCRGDDDLKPGTCLQCSVVTCEIRKELNLKLCSNKCDRYPCKRLKNLDKRYRTKYNMSMLENLEYIAKSGIRAFVANEKERWKCPECGGVICVHRHCCSGCGHS